MNKLMFAIVFAAAALFEAVSRKPAKQQHTIPPIPWTPEESKMPSDVWASRCCS